MPDRLRARVRGASRRACYLHDGRAMVAVLLAQGAGRAPNGIVLPVAADRFRALAEEDSEVRLEAGVLTIGGHAPAAGSWSLDGAARYEGAVHCDRAARGGVPVAGAAESIETIAAALRAHEGADATGDSSFAGLARRRVRGLADALTDAVCAGDARAARTHARALVGLGPGLTPSGDDVLVGFLAARWSMTGSGGDVASAVAGSLDSTTDVSRSFLELAVRGLFAEPLATLVRAVDADDVSTVRTSARDCLAMGATSGADGIVGLLKGYESVFEECRAARLGA